MRITQGCFSFLPDLNDTQIAAQMQYCIDRGWAIGLEYTDDPHPRNTYWEMWGLPMFDLADAAGVMSELADCRASHGDKYIRANAFDSTHGWETVRMSFIVNRPAVESSFELVRTEDRGRNQKYGLLTRPGAGRRPRPGSGEGGGRNAGRW
jgi:ribulose-bisphosphate carboxylase small chain